MKPGDDIAAGDLDQRVAFYAPQYNASGDEIIGYTLIVAGVAAGKLAQQGRETRQAARDTTDQLQTWKIRHRTDIDAATRLTHAGSNYDIVDIRDQTGNRRRLDITTRLVK